MYIEKSLNKARWVLADAPIEQIERVARKHDLPELVARLLCSRGVPDEKIESFLNPSLRNDFPDPFSLAGMESCATYLRAAIQSGRKIAIFGDFDVDGATSSAVLYRFLKALGVEVPVYIPQRLTEGYGPNNEALQSLKDGGAEIVLLLDCGTTAFDTVMAGNNMGLEIIIVDHHEAEDELPEAAHIINPKRKDDTSDLDVLAAVGVTFLLCVAVNKKLREAGAYKDKKEPDLRQLLDLVALGTVCDMVPLTGANRLFVRVGFELMAHTSNVGLKALIEVAGIKDTPDTYHAGFILGPRINAGSRVSKSDLGAKLLATDDAEEAKNIAWTLNDCNNKRKDIQAEMEEQALEKVEGLGLGQQPVIIVDDERWHSGLAGLVAGRLKEKYQKPACVVTYTENEPKEGRGSGRSIPGIHIAQAFIDARNEGLLEKGGGHAMAGGFTVLPDKLEAFKAFMVDHITRQMQSTDTQVETIIDGVVTVRGANPALVKMLANHVGPFGQEHPEPLFLLQQVRIHSADVVGTSHIRVMVSDWEGGTRMKAMAFRAVGTDMGQALVKQSRMPFHLLGTLKLNTWGGRESVEMHIKDAVLADGTL